MNIECSNCGKPGHTFKACINPITSYGMICFRIIATENIIQYLLIQRRHSIAYIDFVKGRYSYENINFLNMLFRNMVTRERENLRTKTFEEIWEDIWFLNTDNKSYRSEHNYAKRKFETIKAGFTSANNLHISITSLLAANESTVTSLEWGFPKGRRNKGENNLHCAKREFTEETNYSENDVILIENIPPFSERFIGTNNTRYEYIYYVCRCKNEKPAEIYELNKSQIAEIGNIAWVTFEEAVKILDHQFPQRQVILTKLNKILKAKYNIIDSNNEFSSSS